MRSAESSRSWMVKAGSRPICSAYSRSSRAPMPWKVPGPGRAPPPRPAAPSACADDPLDAPRHLRGRAAREGQEQDAPRIGAVDDEVRDAVREGVGLARAGAGDDEERCALLALARGMGCRAPLVRIERVEPGSVHQGDLRPRVWRRRELRFLFVLQWAKHRSKEHDDLRVAGGGFVV